MYMLEKYSSTNANCKKYLKSNMAQRGLLLLTTFNCKTTYYEFISHCTLEPLFCYIMESIKKKEKIPMFKRVAQSD